MSVERGDGVVVVPMRRRHLRSVLRIENEVYDNPWSLGLYASELSAPAGRCYRVARSGTRLVGYGGSMYVVDEAHITTLAVHPDHHGRRIGSRLLLELAREAVAASMTSLTLEVASSNQVAQALYRRFGLAPAGIRRGYYEATGEDALIMWAEEIDQPAYSARLDSIEAEVARADAGGARRD